MNEPFVAVPSYALSPKVPATPEAGPATPAHVSVPVPVPVPVLVPVPERGPVAVPGLRPVPASTFGVLAPDVSARDVSALGVLAPFAAGAGVTDLFVNGEAGLWVDSGRGAVRHPEWTSTEASLRALAVSLIARGGRHIDEATPCVDVRLADGIRVHAVLPPASSTGTLLSIRLPVVQRPTLAALLSAGLCGVAGSDASGGESVGTASAGGESVGGKSAQGETSVVEQRLRRAVTDRHNLLITGAAGSGKTTLLAALLAEASPGERIVVIEDVAELRIDHPHVVALECRQPNVEGAGHLGLDRLLREALRMRPDRLVLGECRGGEIRELLGALNTGHDGGAGTLHANTLADVPARLEALGALAGLAPEAVARQAVSAIQLVVHLEQVGGIRRVQALGRLLIDARDRLAVAAALQPAGPGRTGGAGGPGGPGGVGGVDGIGG
ncbi:CpaF family protein, partial [Cryobacterium melibiosiphilum]